MLSARPVYQPFRATEEEVQEETEIPLLTAVEPCSNCSALGEVEDYRTGTIVCGSCAMVKDRYVSTDVEYRLFSDDGGKSAARARVGPSYNPYLPHTNLGTSVRKGERDEYEFLLQGLKNIDDVMHRLLQDADNKPVETRAKELFHKAFHKQFLQKQGVEAKLSEGPGSAIKKPKKTKLTRARQKYSRRKQFVVACLWRALKEHNINSWSIGEISELIEGRDVSKNSVKRCLKDLGFI